LLIVCLLLLFNFIWWIINWFCNLLRIGLWRLGHLWRTLVDFIWRIVNWFWLSLHWLSSWIKVISHIIHLHWRLIYLLLIIIRSSILRVRDVSLHLRLFKLLLIVISGLLTCPNLVIAQFWSLFLTINIFQWLF